MQISNQTQYSESACLFVLGIKFFKYLSLFLAGSPTFRRAAPTVCFYLSRSWCICNWMLNSAVLMTLSNIMSSMTLLARSETFTGYPPRQGSHKKFDTKWCGSKYTL